ncbi:MAG: DUF2203 family protein [Planctomycetes bacterium]|nr:DUF2203 family protein [Planctomycetota bacterium]
MEHMNTTTDVLDAAEANRRLELVRPLVAEIMATTQRLKALSSNKTPDRRDDVELAIERAALEDSFRATLAALNSHGAILKDPHSGLIDFYTWRGDDIAFLCWRHGEGPLAWWHGIHEGFTARKPLDHDEVEGPAAP